MSTAFEMGWARLDNRALLKAADAEFDVLVTTDRNLAAAQVLEAVIAMAEGNS